MRKCGICEEKKESAFRDEYGDSVCFYCFRRARKIREQDTRYWDTLDVGNIYE